MPVETIPTLDDNVEILVKLADRFQVVWLVGDCEQFLKESENYTIVEKIVICANLGLAELQVRRPSCMGRDRSLYYYPRAINMASFEKLGNLNPR